MQRAKEVLSDSDLPLVDVAACVGFRTQAHFTGVFRRYSGLTPRAYRLSNRASALHVEPFIGAAPAPF
jgi:AraC family transcriptional regulator